MRILIGILHCIENEYQECINALQQQTDKNFEYFVLDNLPKKHAADEVYKKFMQNSGEFDIFMKLDADMVIEDSRFLEHVVEEFELRPWMQLLSLPVYDYFTERLIPAVNIYRNDVKFPMKHDGLFTDQNPVPDEKSLFSIQGLDGVVSHCKNPSLFQAFHFGLHRGVKIRYGDIQNLWERVALHCVNHEKVWENFLIRKEARLGQATLSGELAISGLFGPDNVSYGDQFAKEKFFEYEKWSSDDLKKEIIRLRLINFGWLPWWIRLGFINKSGNQKWHTIFKRAVRKLKKIIS